LAEVAHVTRDSDTTFKVKGQLAGAWHIVEASRTAYYYYAPPLIGGGALSDDAV